MGTLGLCVDPHVDDAQARAVALEPSRRDHQVVGVENDLLDPLADLDLHVLATREGRGVQVGLEHEVVATRNDRAGEPVSSFLGHAQSFTYVSQPTYFSVSPLVAEKNAPWSSFVTGPRWPSPTIRSSTSRIGVISAAVPEKKTSSAL